MRSSISLVLACSVALLGWSAPPKLSEQERERTTIRWIAKTLDRFGERTLAERLIRDYHTTKRVRFGELEDANAETGRVSGVGNVMVLSAKNMLAEADNPKRLQQRPWGPSSRLVPYAVTALHEYVHMDQTLPQNFPRWENPAWEAVDRATARWAARLEKELDALLKQPPGPQRDAKLLEIRDLAARLESECGSLHAAVQQNNQNGTLNTTHRWAFPDTVAKLKALRNSAPPPASPPAASKAVAGRWEMVSEIAFQGLAPSDTNYSISVSNGTATMGWSLGTDVFRFEARWTPPPKTIRPEDVVTLDLSVAMLENAGDAYSANGSAVIWIDRPECEPGAVIQPVQLKLPPGEQGALRGISHKAGVPPSPPIRLVIDRDVLPKGAPGHRFAIIVAVYNGRNAGYRYVYEWKSP